MSLSFDLLSSFNGDIRIIKVQDLVIGIVLPLAPYWLMPTLWPLPVPVMVKMPEAFEDVILLDVPPRVTFPELVNATSSPAGNVVTVPAPEMTETPSRVDSRVPLPLT